jgi:AcrR family transcriptional regulator
MRLTDDTQKRVLEAAGRIFAEKGFKGATIREICQRAEANIAAVNYYFRDKEKLYHAALHHAFQCRTEQMPMPQWPEGTPSQQKLRDFIRVVLTRMLEAHSQPWQMQLLVRELSQPTSAGAELVREFIRPVYEFLWGILRELLPDVSEEQLHLISISIVGQCFYLRVGRKVVGLVVGEEEFRTYDTERLIEHITDFSLAAVRAGNFGRRRGPSEGQPEGEP